MNENIGVFSREPKCAKVDPSFLICTAFNNYVFHCLNSYVASLGRAITMLITSPVTHQLLSPVSARKEPCLLDQVKDIS